MTLEEQAATLRPPEIVALLVKQRELQDQNAALQRQVEWFQRQLFGRKSERRLREPDPQQLSLSGMLRTPLPAADQPPPPSETVKAYQRRVRLTGADLAGKANSGSTAPFRFKTFFSRIRKWRHSRRTPMK